MLPEVVLPGGARTTRLGYGCSALLGGRTPREARVLLDAAFDSGIRHFDVARVYGTGDAEAVVGAFAAGRRDSLTIASKFGIDPAGRGATMALGKRMVRFATRRSRRALALARRHSGRTVSRGAFYPEKARESLEVSLGQLGVTHLDLYLLHDCSASDWAQPDLRETLADLAESGRIGAFGPATDRGAIAEILLSDDPPPAVVQHDLSLFEPAPAPGPDRPTPALTIGHGVFRRDFGALRSHLQDPQRAAEWSKALDLDLRSSEVLGDLMLALAARERQGGILLISSSSPERIAHNATCVESDPFDSVQLDAFAGLARGALDAS